MPTKTPPHRSPGPNRTAASRRRTRLAVIGAVIVVVAAAVIAIVLGSSSDKTAAGVEQSRPVTIEGAALPKLDATLAVDPAVGLAAPTLLGSSFDGSPVALKPGAPTLVLVVAHWCPHCQKEVPQIVSWAAAGGVPSGVQVLAISTDVDKTLPNYPPSKWLADVEWPFPVLADTVDAKAAAAMGLPGFPYFVMLDGSGKVLFRASGEIEPELLGQQITAALAPA